MAAEGVTVASGGEEEVDSGLVPAPGGRVEGGLVVTTAVFEGRVVAEELGDDGNAAFGRGSVQSGVAEVWVGVGWHCAAVCYIGAGGEGGGQEGEGASLRGKEEHVVFVFRDEERL